MIPLVQRAASALAMWLSPAYGSIFTLRPDLDQLDALAPERDALWTRINAASFLTPDEKRAAAGYGALPPGQSLTGKAGFNSGQDRVPAGNGQQSGRWAGAAQSTVSPSSAASGDATEATDPSVGSGVSEDGRLQRVADDGRPGYPINILEEDALGGHTFPRHVNKPEEYLKARITGSRINIPLVGTFGEKRAGSFPSLEAANKLANSTLSQNEATIARFMRTPSPFDMIGQHVFAQFGSPTGYEAYSPDPYTAPIMRPTYGVKVYIRKTKSNNRGWYVHSAFPINED